MARIGLMLYTVREACASRLRGTPARRRRDRLRGRRAVRPARARARRGRGLARRARRSSLSAATRGSRRWRATCPRWSRSSRRSATSGCVLSWVDPAASTTPTLAPDRRRCSRAGGERRARASASTTTTPSQPPTLAGFLDELLDGSALPRARPRLGLVRGRGPALPPRTRPRPVPARAREGLLEPRAGRVRPVGDGSVGYERIAPAAIAAGAEWLLVEQDETDGTVARGRPALVRRRAHCRC